MAKHSMELAQNPYGNYAIQVALDSFDVEQCAPLLESFRGKFAQLSMLKFSSNAIERCLEKADLKRRNDILKELISPEKLLGIPYNFIYRIALMKNNFGNYVVQKALMIAEGDMKVEIGMAIQENIPHLSDKKLKTKWIQILDKSLNLRSTTSSLGSSKNQVS